MGKSIEMDQSHAIMAILSTNLDWGELDGDLLQDQVIRNPKEAGRHFTRFLQNGARMSMVGDFKITAVPFNPVSFIGRGWQVIAEEEDKRSSELAEIDYAKAEFTHCLIKEKSSITGEEFLCRLKETGNIRLGATAFMGLWNDYKAKTKDSAIERFYQEGKIKKWLYFFGTILLDPVGDRDVLYFYRDDDGEWDWNVDWLEDYWDAEDLAVLLQV